MKPLPPPPQEVIDFLDTVRFTAEQGNLLDDLLITHSYRIGWLGQPLQHPDHILLQHMVSVGIPVPICAIKYLETVKIERKENTI